MTETRTHHLPAGSTATGPYPTVVTPESAGWDYSGLKVLELAPGGAVEIDTGDAETLVLPLAGGCAVACDGEVFELRGRDDVFSRVTDFAYLPRDARATVRSASGGRFALPSARCERRLAARYGPAEDVPVELRGAGQCSRQVNNFCTPQTFDADRLIACEVLTPGANWSSYPPHKHDEATATECALEEVYYFEIAPGPEGPGVAYQRVYGTPDRPADVMAEVRGGDVVLIPHGWHGPSMAAPGYDLYYLNVMAGPGAERAWLIRDDPAHGWIRRTWADQDVDPRLPLCTADGRKR
ncbi:5-deoxy-glucuronate isomerase [Actinorugispora endophytica]|uniref:5-deoxyglucuronate isomerase n=1 Tax=Actinorugispora endophytica TaxID=1605990 RepID=A0A4R6V2K4_9ACTN|nr:5-deoxy-glucuronate isomerase [Actinorugispora endophytica]TDQ54203.1 5-deoxyglucuronate isomerase [Actinorugispora endophytica]